eukprot:3391588-Prymnesium_polylepis.3
MPQRAQANAQWAFTGEAEGSNRGECAAREDITRLFGQGARGALRQRRTRRTRPTTKLKTLTYGGRAPAGFAQSEMRLRARVASRTTSR